MCKRCVSSCRAHATPRCNPGRVPGHMTARRYGGLSSLCASHDVDESRNPRARTSTTHSKNLREIKSLQETAEYVEDASGRGPRAARGGPHGTASESTARESDRSCSRIALVATCVLAGALSNCSYCLAFDGGASETHISSVKCVSQAIPLDASLPVPRVDAASRRENRVARNRN